MEASHVYFYGVPALSQVGAGQGDAEMNRQWLLVVLRGLCGGADVCLSDSDPGLTLPRALFSASLCLSFSPCKMGY